MCERTKVAHTGGVQGTTIGDLVSSVGDPVLRVAHAAGDLRAPVGEVVILDPTDTGSAWTEALVLAVGVTADGGDAVSLVDRAGREGATAVVLRTDRDLPERLCDIARGVGLTLLTVPPEMPWGQLYSLLRTATATTSPGTGTSGAAAVGVGDLFALADAVAVAVGAPVTIEDPQWRVLAYSNLDQPLDEPRRQTILGRTPPPEWQTRLEEAGIIRALRSGEGVVRFAHEGIAPRVAVPVRAGTEMLGSIWAAGDLPESAEQELSQAARLAAIHMIAHRASEDVERRTRGAAVRELLDGRRPAGAQVRPGPWSVIAFEPAGGSWDGDPDRILSILALFAESVHPEAMCAQVAGRLWALIPSTSERGAERLTTLAERVVERAERVLGERLLAGIGSCADRLTDLPRARHSAEQALVVLGRRADGCRIAHIDDVRSHALLMELLDLAATHGEILEGPLAALSEDQRLTLRTWLDCHGDVAGAAERLQIHPNTLRYRVRRISEATGLDFGDPDQRLLAEVQLRVRDLVA